MLLRRSTPPASPGPGRPATAAAPAARGPAARRAATPDRAAAGSARSRSCSPSSTRWSASTQVKAEVRRLTSLLRIQQLRAERGLPTIETSHHLVFTGNPGTGKTTVARLLSQICARSASCRRATSSRPTAPTSSPATSARPRAQTQAVLESALGGTLLIDEAYALARGGEKDFGREAIDTLVKFMEDHRDDLAVDRRRLPGRDGQLIDANPGLREPVHAHDPLPRLHDRGAGARSSSR